jgi:OmcA/MtrC family decaheme c-type cytochrome
VQGIVKGTAMTSVGMLASPAMPANPARFPAGAKLRTVALQGYFTQMTPALARHAVMVTKSVTGESRRLVVDSAKCALCHEYFEGHGGNRNYNMDGCTVCHNPNLSSSGTIINDPTTPEATQNLKDMIHEIHAAEMRTNPYKHTRSKTGSNTVYDWSGVVYPNLLYKCEACHKPGTYVAVPAGALPTTDVTPVTGLLGNTVFYARLTVGTNPTDIVISPYSAACVSCHDSSAAKSHMTANGGVINKTRTAFTAGTEQCVICHGAGRSADAAAVHANYVPGGH